MSTNFSRLYFVSGVTATAADPAVFTLTDHGLVPGDIVRLETTGTLPAGFSLLTSYYVVYNGITTSTFQLAASDGGTPKAATSTGTGTHSIIRMNRSNLSPRYENNR